MKTEHVLVKCPPLRGKGRPKECWQRTKSTPSASLFSTGAPVRVMMPMLATTYGESVTWKDTRKVRHPRQQRAGISTESGTWTPYLVRVDPTGPMLKGITYMVRPAGTGTAVGVCEGPHGPAGTYRTRHAPGEALLPRPLPVAVAHPAAELTLHPRRRDGDGVPLLLGHDHSLALYPGHILRVRARQPTTSTAGIRNGSGRRRRGN